MFPDNTIILHYSGSQSYGTNHEGSDEDIRGVYAAPKHIVNTPFYAREEYEVINVEEHEDAQLWELSKFIREIAGASPSYIETLFIPNEHIIKSSEAYRYLREQSDIFVTQQLAKGYLGFAESQLRKVQLSVKMGLENADIHNYKRRSLVEQYGYDTKYALHAMRTVLMAREIVENQTVTVKRPEAAMLKSNFVEGNLPYEQFITLFNEERDKALNAIKFSSHLPERVEREKAAILLIEAQELALK